MREYNQKGFRSIALKSFNQNSPKGIEFFIFTLLSISTLFYLALPTQCLAQNPSYKNPLSKKPQSEIVKIIQAKCPTYKVADKACPSRCVNSELLELMAETPRRITSGQFLSLMDDCSKYSPKQILVEKKVTPKIAKTTKPSSLSSAKKTTDLKTSAVKPTVIATPTSKPKVVTQVLKSTPKAKAIVKSKPRKTIPKTKPSRIITRTKTPKPKLRAKPKVASKKKVQEKLVKKPVISPTPSLPKKRPQKSNQTSWAPDVTSVKKVDCSKGSEYQRALKVSKIKQEEYRQIKDRKGFNIESKFSKRLEAKLKTLQQSCTTPIKRKKRKYQ